MAADHGHVARRAVAAAVACTPNAPALLECHWLGWRLEHLGISERDVVRQFLALRRKAERGAGRAGDAAPAIHERVEHQVEELALHLEADLLRAGGGLAGKLRERVAKVGAGEIEKRDEVRRQ